MNALRKYLKTVKCYFICRADSVGTRNKIESIHVEVELHEDGSATINETRQMETHEDPSISNSKIYKTRIA